MKLSELLTSWKVRETGIKSEFYTQRNDIVPMTNAICRNSLSMLRTTLRNYHFVTRVQKVKQGQSDVLFPADIS